MDIEEGFPVLEHADVTANLTAPVLSVVQSARSESHQVHTQTGM